MDVNLQKLETDRNVVLALLWQEFARLNDTYFERRLELREIKLSTRKQYGGYYQKTKSLIVLSWPAHLEHGWDETLNTFRHEVAHIVYQDHSRNFWAVAYRLGCTRRHALAPTERKSGYYKYTYECPGCKAQVFRRKRLVKASCGKCDRAFNPAFQLRLVASPGIANAAKQAA